MILVYKIVRTKYRAQLWAWFPWHPSADLGIELTTLELLYVNKGHRQDGNQPKISSYEPLCLTGYSDD